MIDLEKIEEEILDGLKDFQLATVKRVYKLYKSGYSRVLVGDEVGLGKTLIARGTISKLAKNAYENLKNNQNGIFKVIYICSNQSIASQNINKLRIDKKVYVDEVSDTRLSMQHLKIYENDNNDKINQNFIQITPLTPTTSFNMTNGCGSVRERALTYAILSRYEHLKSHNDSLEKLLTDRAQSAWDSWAKSSYEERVVNCDKDSNYRYLKEIIDRVDNYFNENSEVLQELIYTCQNISRKNNENRRKQRSMIQTLRRMMAIISVDLMNPDLVIMDEFQRFKEIIDTNDDNETTILARKFFSGNSITKTKILLLSATPYKLYSTLEEINASGVDEHYKEFMTVMNFIFEEEKEINNKFKEVWRDYSTALNLVTKDNFAALVLKKNEAEDYLYKGICRTERMLVPHSEDILDDDKSKDKVKVDDFDILSFVQMDHLVNDIGLKYSVPIEYVKSAPYIMSFMNTYKLKTRITKHFEENPKLDINMAKGDKMWINPRKINKYEPIHMGNGKMEKLKELSFNKNAEKLLWVPPSRPYYPFGGAFKGNEDFSKILVFSAWEMVPRAIATMMSYEAERLTVGKLAKSTPNKERENRNYFHAKLRFPAARVKYNMPSSLCLLYPSVTLAKLFNSIDIINKDMNLKELKKYIGDKIDKLLELLADKVKSNGRSSDKSWYYIAPLLFDLKFGYMDDFFANSRYKEDISDEEEGANEKENITMLVRNFDDLRNIYFNEECITLGKMPSDLKDILINMTLGSPTISSLRMYKDYSSESLANAVKLGKIIADRFNLTEATAIVELQYGKKSDDAHWKNILKYCIDGNIQSMLDEYAHMLSDGNDMNNMELKEKNKLLTTLMCNNLKNHRATYNVDTFDSFRNRINGGKERPRKMRSSYAAGFCDVKQDNGKIQRKENLRHSFNSPFRPFILATTSIGQEGLDFHYYCRKIVHWNLPSNPIDLEQREGRINRYKCLAIRQNIVNKYGNIEFEYDIWKEMFDFANSNEARKNQCELVPFWCLPGDTKVKIERIVPNYPFSKDYIKYERLNKILSLYRLSLGQGRQQELLEYLFNNDINKEDLEKLFMNLSPINK